VQQAECRSGKKAFRTRKKGLKALSDQRRSMQKWGIQGNKGNGAVSVYRCRYCGEWHMTSKRYANG